MGWFPACQQGGSRPHYRSGKIDVTLSFPVFIFSKHITAQKLTFQLGLVCDSFCKIIQNIASLGSNCPKPGKTV